MSSRSMAVNPRDYDTIANYNVAPKGQLRATDFRKISKIAALIFDFISKTKVDLHQQDLTKIQTNLTNLQIKMINITEGREATTNLLRPMDLELTDIRIILISSESLEQASLKINKHVQQLESMIKIYLPLEEVSEEDER